MDWVASRYLASIGVEIVVAVAVVAVTVVSGVVADGGVDELVVVERWLAAQEVCIAD